VPLPVVESNTHSRFQLARLLRLGRADWKRTLIQVHTASPGLGTAQNSRFSCGQLRETPIHSVMDFLSTTSGVVTVDSGPGRSYS